jgi:hypothetical protein
MSRQGSAPGHHERAKEERPGRSGRAVPEPFARRTQPRSPAAAPERTWRATAARRGGGCRGGQQLHRPRPHAPRASRKRRRTPARGVGRSKATQPRSSSAAEPESVRPRRTNRKRTAHWTAPAGPTCRRGCSPFAGDCGTSGGTVQRPHVIHASDPRQEAPDPCSGSSDPPLHGRLRPSMATEAPSTEEEER